MVEVNLWSGLRHYTDGRDRVEIDGATTGEILRGLVAAYPELDPIIAAGVSVAVDGKIFANSLTAPIKPDSEVYLLQQLKGG